MSRTDLTLRIGGAVTVAVCLFALPWYGRSLPAAGAFAAAHASTVTGWSSVGPLRFLLLLTAVVPARPAVVLAGVSGVWLLLRLTWLVPDPGAVLDPALGGFLALAGVGAIGLGAWESPAARARG